MQGDGENMEFVSKKIKAWDMLGYGYVQRKYIIVKLEDKEVLQ